MPCTPARAASTTEEAAAVAEELSSQAELLKNMVAQFRLGNDETYMIEPQAEISEDEIETTYLNSVASADISPEIMLDEDHGHFE